jgi:ribosomal protein L28
MNYFTKATLMRSPMLNFVKFAPVQQRSFGALVKNMFGTDTPSQSKRYHLGLFHLKTHSQRKKRVFSMKYRIETQKPNIYKKKLHSDLLNRDFKLWISMKTRKCIMKSGSLDKYLLNTKSAHIDSKFGIYLKSVLI